MAIPSGRWSWSTILSFPWKVLGSHINEYELRALFAFTKWLCRKARNLGLRYGVLVDSQVVLSVAAKGRSSSHRLNRLIRRYDVLLLAGFFYPFFGYVASADNPADHPSRCHPGGE